MKKKLVLKKKKTHEYMPSLVEIERRRRIQVAVWAYAYELMDEPLVSDERYDQVALLINPAISTGHKLDSFYRTEFTPYTGQWIHNHPDLAGIKRLYERLKSYDEKIATKKESITKKKVKKKLILKKRKP